MTPLYRLTRVLFISLAALGTALAVNPRALRAESLAGSYLAANQANFDSDYKAAALYFARAVARDPGNTDLMQNLLLAHIGLGEIEKSLAVAGQMEALGAKSQLAELVILADNVRRGEFAAANRAFSEGQTFSPLLDGLLRGWVFLGLGRMSDATDTFEQMADANAMAMFADYNQALALALVGDFEGAAELFSQESDRPLRLGRSSLIAHVEILSQLERGDEALAMARSALGDSGDPELLELIGVLERGETLGFRTIRDAKDGAAEVFLTLASVLAADENDRFALIYGRLAEFVRPGSVAAILQVSKILNTQGQYDLAVENYNKVPSDHPLFYSAEIGRSEALQSAGKVEAGIEVLRSLSKGFRSIPNVHTALGDALRRDSRFAEATKAYDAAIALLPERQPAHWFLYYSRGITFERTDGWAKAEADFRLALELSPDQPLVLNYLGYGLVERREKLDEAQKMIRTAVSKRPNDGYITDSLGWVYYRLGKFAEAVDPMERAVELLPVDPIINDHLGDAYWMVGRILEARFQWRRALSFEPEEADAKRIRRKLEVGLDEVLKVEATETATK